MPTDPLQLAGLSALVLFAAVLYSSVGHAGASGYLAAMALFGVAPAAMKPAALVMNILVAAVGTWRFAAARLVPWRLLGPLLAGSVPAAFAGGLLQLEARSHRVLLGVVLLFAAARLVWPGESRDGRHSPPAPPWLALMGAAIGLVAGLTGVGGGIFLSPLLILSGWEEVRPTAGASVTFILANSVAGLLGHLSGSQFVPPGTAPLALVALAGGLYGSWLGARRLSTLMLRRGLALVLLIAGAKLLAS